MKTPIGVDLSLTSTGLSCGDNQIAITTKLRGVERLNNIAQTVLQFVMNYSNPIAIIEGYSFASRNSQAHSIGELGGVVRLELWRANIPFIDIAPTIRAKFATGRGNANKNEVISAVSARTGIVWEGGSADDLCDAFILEEIGRVKNGNPRHIWPASHLAALDKIEWGPLV